MGTPSDELFASIVVGIDGSPAAGAALAHAISLAVRAGARLHVVSVYEPPADRLAEEPLHHQDEIEWSVSPHADVLALLEHAAVNARKAGLSEVEAFPRQGDAADAILDVAEELQADLIVIGHKGMTGADRFLLGSVPHRISHHAPCSVLIIRT